MVILQENKYKYGVTRYEDRMFDCPLYTYYTINYFGAKLVQARLERNGLKSDIYDLSIEECPGLNPIYEDL